MGAEWMEASSDEAAELWEACDEHEDYVWTNVNGSRAAGEMVADRPAAGMSVYWVCDAGRGALIDLLAVAPFWLSMFFAVDLRFLRVIRLLRVLKLTRYSAAMNLLFEVMRDRMRVLGAALFVNAQLLDAGFVNDYRGVAAEAFA